MAEERLLTAEETATYLKVCRETVYRLARKGQIPAVRVGGQWRFRERDILEWLQHAFVA